MAHLDRDSGDACVSGRISRRLLFVLALLVGAGAAPAFADDALPTLVVERQLISRTYPVSARIEAVQQATVSARVPGRVIELAADVGDTVAAGALLARIDADEATQARSGATARLAQSQSQLALAEANLRRVRELHERGFVAESALEQAELGARAARADVDAARAAGAQAGVVEAYARIDAPFAGVIGARHIEAGDTAQPGQRMFEIFAPGALRAVAQIAQYRLADLGTAAHVRVELPESGEWAEASSVEILPVADLRTHTVEVRVGLPPSSTAIPGSFARVHFLFDEGLRLAVPEQAVLRRGELTGVFVLDGDGRYRLRQLRLGEPLGAGQLEVLAGLQGGERIALDPVRAGILARSSARQP